MKLTKKEIDKMINWDALYAMKPDEQSELLFRLRNVKGPHGKAGPVWEQIYKWILSRSPEKYKEILKDMEHWGDLGSWEKFVKEYTDLSVMHLFLKKADSEDDFVREVARVIDLASIGQKDTEGIYNEVILLMKTMEAEHRYPVMCKWADIMVRAIKMKYGKK